MVNMAREAMTACAISRGELRAQLISDIRETRLQDRPGRGAAARTRSRRRSIR